MPRITTKVSHMGNALSSDGVAPDPEKVRAISEMSAPTDAKAVTRSLGLANYLMRFVPSFADTAAPLREVTKSSNTFVWLGSQQTAFEKIKKMLTEAPTLTFFDT